MKQLKTLSLALMALFALTGIIAASAQALPTLPSILPEGTAKLPLTGTTETGASEFGGGGLQLTGTKGKGSNSATSAKLGTFIELYEGVRGPATEKCNGVGKAAGTVETTGTFHVRDYKESTTLKTALIFLTNPITIECEGGLKIEVKGCAAAAVSPESKLTKTLTVTLSRVAKTQETIRTVLNEENTANEICELLSNSGSGFGPSSQTQTSKLSGFKQNAKEVEVLVMPL